MRCNRQKLAVLMGKDVKTIDKMVAQGMPYVSRPGKPPGQREWVFDTRRVLYWMAGVIDPQVGKDAKRRLAAAKASLKELDLYERQGLLVRRDEIARRVTAGDAIVMSRLRDIPGRVAQLVAIESDPTKVEEILMKEFLSALAQLDKPWNERG